MKPWKLLDSEYLVDAPWLKVAKEKCELTTFTLYGNLTGC